MLSDMTDFQTLTSVDLREMRGKGLLGIGVRRLNVQFLTNGGVKPTWKQASPPEGSGRRVL